MEHFQGTFSVSESFYKIDLIKLEGHTYHSTLYVHVIYYLQLYKDI